MRRRTNVLLATTTAVALAGSGFTALTAAAASNSGTSLTIPAVPCDGAIHQVLFIATGTNAKSSTQAVAFRAPG